MTKSPVENTIKDAAPTAYEDLRPLPNNLHDNNLPIRNIFIYVSTDPPLLCHEDSEVIIQNDRVCCTNPEAVMLNIMRFHGNDRGKAVLEPRNVEIRRHLVDPEPASSSLCNPP